jgi:hypothetical protein
MYHFLHRHSLACLIRILWFAYYSYSNSNRSFKHSMDRLFRFSNVKNGLLFWRRSGQDRVPAVAPEPGHLPEVVRDNRELLRVGGGGRARGAGRVVEHGRLHLQRPGRAHGRLPVLTRSTLSRSRSRSQCSKSYPHCLSYTIIFNLFIISRLIPINKVGSRFLTIFILFVIDSILTYLEKIQYVSTIE